MWGPHFCGLFHLILVYPFLPTGPSLEWTGATAVYNCSTSTLPPRAINLFYRVRLGAGLICCFGVKFLLLFRYSSTILPWYLHASVFICSIWNPHSRQITSLSDSPVMVSRRAPEGPPERFIRPLLAGSSAPTATLTRPLHHPYTPAKFLLHFTSLCALHFVYAASLNIFGDYLPARCVLRIVALVSRVGGAESAEYLVLAWSIVFFRLHPFLCSFNC